MLVHHAEKTRRDVSPQLNLQRKSALGQFMTPSPVAAFMAAMFPPSDIEVAKLLDAGAGIGALSSAFLERWQKKGFAFSRVEVTAHELDDALRGHLSTTLAQFVDPKRLVANVVPGDFIIQTTAGGKDDFWKPWVRADAFSTEAVKGSWAYMDTRVQYRRDTVPNMGIEKPKNEDNYWNYSTGANGLDDLRSDISGTMVGVQYNGKEVGLMAKVATQFDWTSTTLEDCHFVPLRSGTV